MKILHIDSERTWRGGQNQVRLLIDGCLSLSHQVHLAAPEDSALFDVMKSAVPTCPFNLRHGMDLKAAAKLGRYCLEQGIDVVDAHSSKAHTLGLFAVRHSPFTKLVVHRRVDYIPGRDPLNQWKYRTRRVAAYVAISGAIGSILRNYGIKDERIHVVHSAASPMSFTYPTKEAAKSALAQKMKLDPRIPWIGNASALTDQKDFPTLLRAVANLKQQGVRFQCLIAGTGHREQSLHKLAKQLELDTHVRFLGFRDDVPDILHSLDILAISSAFEGLGTVILDGLQAGCCVVATDVGGIPEVIAHGHTGLLSPVGDSTAYAANLHKAISSDSQRKLLADCGRRHVEENFSAEKMTRGNLKVYEGLFA